ncbi:MAG TPA: hypothetical protein GYA07_05070 [Verrucomicrobia bacterium]|nr:hypothetical protein [Verrucomicrobiota bacterium]HOQ47876.1 hypothetical protein [Bryobacteraceae bacterium]
MKLVNGNILPEGRVIDEASPEAQRILAQVNWKTGRLKKFDPLYESQRKQKLKDSSES